MSVQLTAKEPTVDDDVARFGATMVADKSHVSGQKRVICKPSVDGLPSEVAVWFEGRIDDAGWAKKGAGHAWVMTHKDIAKPSPVCGTNFEKAISFWSDAVIGAECGLKPDGTGSLGGTWFVAVNDMLEASASHHCAGVHKRADIINVIIIPIAWVRDFAWSVVEGNGVFW